MLVLFCWKNISQQYGRWVFCWIWQSFKLKKWVINKLTNIITNEGNKKEEERWWNSKSINTRKREREWERNGNANDNCLRRMSVVVDAILYWSMKQSTHHKTHNHNSFVDYVRVVFSAAFFSLLHFHSIDWVDLLNNEQ